MVRKSTSRSSKAVNSKIASNLINLNFEVVLVIVLIIVAILLACFLSKKFGANEQFVDVTRQVQNQQSKQVHFFYANWCGYSRNYLNDPTNGIEQLRKMINSNNLVGSLVEHDVDSDTGRAVADIANVSKLPSFYKVENGSYTQFEGPINNQSMIDWLNQ